MKEKHMKPKGQKEQGSYAWLTRYQSSYAWQKNYMI